MYEYFEGKIVKVDSENIVIDINGIGYKLEVPTSLRDHVSVGSERMIFAEQIVSENRIAIFGFYNEDQKWIFNLLRSVSKVGPKTALGIVGALNTDEIINAINIGDDKLLATCPGIGAKTAARIIIELKDKVKSFIVSSDELADNPDIDLIDALEGLGYSRYEITKHIAKLDLKGLELDEMIKVFLKTIN